MKGYLKILMIISSIWIIACDSDDVDVTEFKGIVLSYSSNQTMSDILVSIERNDGISFGSFTEPVYDTVRTNSVGEYSYKISSNDKTYYRLDILSENYISLFSTIPLDKAINQKSVNLDTIKIGESATLKLNLVTFKSNNAKSYPLINSAPPIDIGG